jgi:hypothetical protein
MLTPESAKVRELRDLESFGAIKEIWKIEPRNVVPDDHIGIHLCNEIAPGLEQLLFILESKDLRANNV